MAMPRPYSRKQALQNAAFLRVLAQTGNARDAARSLGLNRSMLTKRRNADPDFAQRWEAAQVVAANRIADPDLPPGEARVVRSAGRLQLRMPGKGRHIDLAAEQIFLSALSATANVRLAAKAAGFAHSSFYARARTHPGFAREMRLALAQGCERLEMALLEDSAPEANTHDHWRHNDPPPIPRMTAAEALQAMAMHRRPQHSSVDPDIWRKRGESSDAWSERRRREHAIERAREAEDARLIDYARSQAGAKRSEFEPPAPLVPPLEQVAWRDKERTVTEEGKGLFGGNGFGSG